MISGILLGIGIAFLIAVVLLVVAVVRLLGWWDREARF
jgi:predicted RND superfamily exporter protein